MDLRGVLKRGAAILLTGAMLAGYLPQAVPAFAQDFQPSEHVIHLVLDGLNNDLYDQIKASGAQTPNLDKLAAEGTRINGINTVIPAFGGSQAAALTGDTPTDNGYYYRYYDRENNQLVQNDYEMQSETIFGALKRQEGFTALASGWTVGNASINGKGVFTSGDEDFVLKEYELENKDIQNKGVIEFDTVANDIIAAIESDTIPSLMSGYSNDIKMVAWENPSVNTNMQPFQEKLEQIDAKLGELLAAVEKAGIKDSTTILITALADSTRVEKKYTNTTLTANITNQTGVKTETIGDDAKTGESKIDIPEGTKAFVVKNYVMHDLQLYFTEEATQEDRQKVKEYLEKDIKVGEVYSHEELGLPSDFCDLYLTPAEGYSFCSTSTYNYKNGSQKNKDMLVIASGANILTGGQLRDGGTIQGIAPTICSLLGAEAPANAEESAWNLEQLSTAPIIRMTSPQNNSTLTQDTVTVSGSVDQVCTVTVNGQNVTLGQDNTFRTELSLSEGENLITIVAENADRRSTTLTLNVYYLNRPEAPEGNRVIYINWDGFANYYIDLAREQGKIPNLSNIIDNEGTYFENAQSILPSITNPSQAAIASGATPKYTGNHYRYFNKEENKVIQETPARRCETETIAEAAVRQGLNVISINQFAFEDKGTSAGTPYANYVNAPASNGVQDGQARFDELIKLIRTKSTSDGMTYEELPQFIALYCDDLDAIGHNEVSHYGVPLATTETQRRQNIVDRLALLDAKVGELIQACKDAGIYDTTTFILTTDHGMANFGIQESEEEDNATTKLPDLMSTIDALGDGFKTEFLHPTGTTTPSEDTDIAVVTAGLQVQLSYIGENDPEVIAQKNAKILDAIKDKVYVGEIMEPDGIAAKGSKSGFADLIISPKTPYFFHATSMNARVARGQHDSLQPEAQNIATMMWGAGVKKGYTYTEPMQNTDLMPTAAVLMGINLPMDANGNVLYDALTEIEEPELYEKVIETSENMQDGAIIGGQPGESFELSDVPEADSVEIRYAAQTDVILKLYHNGKEMRSLYFPSTGGSDQFDTKPLNLTMSEGDTLKLVQESTSGSGEITFDSFTFVNDKPFLSEAVQAVIDQIEALPQEIALADKESVQSARAAYDALSAKEQEQVTNLEKLIAAENVIAQLEQQESDRRVQAVIDQIEALPQEITLADKESVQAARAAYDALSAEEQAQVTNLEKLTAAEAAIAKLEATEEPVNPGEGGNPQGPQEGSGTPVPNPGEESNSVQTGDASNIAAIALWGTGALCAIAAVSLQSRKKKN